LDIMHVFPSLLGWVQATGIGKDGGHWERRRAWWMVGVGGGEVVLRITGVCVCVKLVSSWERPFAILRTI
jgi:hypothetical protein